jgi:hypothetical protein
MRGRAELQSGVVLVLVGAVGLALLELLHISPTPSGADVFTGQGFISAVAAIILIGVLVIGIGLLLLGGILRLIQRRRDERTQSR